MEEEKIIQKLQEGFEAQDRKMGDILEIVNFLKDNSVTKDEFQQHVGEFQSFKEQTTEEFRKVRSEIIDHVDGFVGLHQHLEIELAAVTNKTNRLESQVSMIAKHLQLQLEK
mgnify:CR=1 FL=1